MAYSYFYGVQLFYDPELSPGPYSLREVEARHAVQVLRKRVGDTLDLVDGRGSWFRGTILNTGKRICELDVELIRRESHRAAYRVTLLFGPPKTADRLEWLLEKATEIGVDRLQPVICEHGERRKLKPERLNKILESATKQSLQAWLPELLPLCPLEDALPPADRELGLMAYIDTEIRTPLIQSYRPGQDVRLLIGPEGGFSLREAELARRAGYHLGSLGSTRLRTETAAAVALRDILHVNLLDNAQ